MANVFVQLLEGLLLYAASCSSKRFCDGINATEHAPSASEQPACQRANFTSEPVAMMIPSRSPFSYEVVAPLLTPVSAFSAVPSRDWRSFLTCQDPSIVERSVSAKARFHAALVSYHLQDEDNVGVGRTRQCSVVRE